MSDSLEDLFDGSAPEASSPPAPEPQAQPAEQAQEQPQATQEPPATEAQKDDQQPPAAGTAAGKGQGAPPAPEDNDGRDPAFGRLRKERNDYREQLSTEKVERARAEERFAAEERARKTLEAELAQLRAAPQQQPAVHMPNPVEDPQGYDAVMQQRLWVNTLNTSEMILKSQVDPAEVDAKITAFKAAADANPALGAELRRQAHPFKWAYDYVRRQEAMAEIGTDPAAYKAKVEADLRAQLEADIRAQLAGQAPQQAAVPETPSAPRQPLPPSLAKTPNAGARSGPAFTGPDPIETLWN